MRYICFSQAEPFPQLLTREMFEEKTHKKPPFYMGNSCFAVCPYCLNPVQVIGIMKELKRTEAPYAKHHPYLVKKLQATVDEVKYRYCPFSDIRRHSAEKGAVAAYSDMSDRILQTLWEQFDRVVFVVENQLPFKFPTAVRPRNHLISEFLHDFVTYEAWLFPEISVKNIPWMFFYCTNFHKLFQCKIVDPKLRAAIENEKTGVRTAQINTEGFVIKDGFEGLGFCFIHHQYQIEEGKEPVETFKLQVVKDKKRAHSGVVTANADGIVLYEKTITFDTQHFYNPIHTKNLSYESIHQQQLSMYLPLLEACGLPKPRNPVLEDPLDPQ